MAEFPVKLYSMGQWSDTALPEWADGEFEPDWLRRIGYSEVDGIGNTGAGDGVQVYSANAPNVNQLPEFLVCMDLHFQSTYVAVPDHLSLLQLHKEFAPLLQLFYFRAVFDALFQNERGFFESERLDKLRDFIKQ